MKRVLLAAGLAAAALAAPAGAAAGTITLHPAGFGAHAYSSWKAQQGLPDANGSGNQALYFQKDTATATPSAGVAVVKGISGLPATDLTGLSWDHREDGHCGAGAPRWNVNLTDTAGHSYTVFLGCNAAAHTDKGAGPNGLPWCHDTFAGPGLAAQIAGQTGQALGNLTVSGLAIIFDEGTDNPNPVPPGCGQTQLAGGFVYLDNIEVATSNPAYPTKCWTSASDNANSSTGPCADPPAAPALPVLPTLPVGLSVDPTDTPLTTALGLAEPGVPLSDWLLYPNVS